jgi:hypothetical protein
VVELPLPSVPSATHKKEMDQIPMELVKEALEGMVRATMHL